MSRIGKEEVVTDMGGVTTVGRCWGCDYPLAQIESRNCPECGRAFDPADERSTNTGRPMGRVARWLAAGAGWPTLLLALGGLVGMAVATRWPSAGWRWAWLDLRHYYWPEGWRGRSESFDGVDWAYVGGAAAIALAVAWAVLRVLMMWGARWRWRLRLQPKVTRRGVARGVLLVVICVWAAWLMALGWPYRMGRVVVREAAAGKPMYWGAADSDLYSAVALMLGQGRTSADRVGALGILCQFYSEHLVDAAQVADETDPAVAALTLRLIGMRRAPGTAEFLEPFLDDPRPEVRAGAADGLGAYHTRAYPIETFGAAITGMAPPLTPWAILEGGHWNVPDGANYRKPLSAERRARLSAMMLGAATAGEREAAARALLPWPEQGYKLRWAEWGVWVVSPQGAVAPAYDMTADLPPFVRPTGDKVAAVLKRATVVEMDITKPVVHVTADRPMVLDASASIRKGRTWYAWPTPDDYVLSDEMWTSGFGRSGVARIGALPPPPGLTSLDPPAGVAPLVDPWHGYPWLRQANVLQGSDDVATMGVRWQSLIVSPAKLSWMSERPVPAGARFAWWRRLREVEGAWVSSRGESERFLYYDGPTQLQFPVAFSLDEGRLVVTPVAEKADVAARGGRRGGYRPAWHVGQRDALLVRVAGGRVTSAERVAVTIPVFDAPAARPVGRAVPAGQEVAALREMLTARGLSDGEANGMIDCWRKEFFERDGVRLLTMLAKSDYDIFCPLSVRPTPTELVRVGVIWAELSGGGK